MQALISPSLVLVLLATIAAAQLEKNYASELYHASARGKLNKNFVVSPFVVRAALSPIYLGAHNETQLELKQGLHITCPTKKELARKINRLLTRSMNELNGSLYFASGLILNENIPIDPRFKVLGAKFLQSDLASVDLRPEKSVRNAKAVNKWVEHKTAKKVRHFVEPVDFDWNMSIWVLSAIYFKADWAIIFRDQLMKTPFRTSLNKKEPVHMIHNFENYLPYGRLPELDAEVVELPFRHDNLTMLIIFPKHWYGLNQIAQRLLHTRIARISDKLNKTCLNIQMPKFNIEHGISMRKPLESMGIKQIFTNPDLSSLSSQPNELHVNDVTHKAVISISETNTGPISACTSNGMSPQQLILNHPFFFAIKNAKTIFLTGHFATL